MMATARAEGRPPRGRRALPFALSLLLAVSAWLSGFPGAAVPVRAAAIRNVQSGAGTRTAVGVGGSLSYRAIVNGPFVGFGFRMPTWCTTNSEATLAVYRWDTDCRTTWASAPLASRRFAPLQDNALHRVDFDALPAGEYLFCVMDPVGSVGVWANVNVSDTLGFLYDGETEKRVEPDLNIYFEEAPDEPFGRCVPLLSIDGKHTAPPPYELPADSLIRTHEVMPDTWVFTDGLGRESLTNRDVGDPRADRTVGLFYWTWHASQGYTTPFNNQKFLEEHPEALHDYHHPGWMAQGPVVHAWNEPIYGFYRNTDEWVVRRQGELLASAGVDAIFADNTNGTATWRSAYQSVFRTWSQAMDDGVRTPKVSFILPFAAGADTVTQLEDMYLDFYRRGDYQKLWFYWEDKPLIMAHRNSLDRSDPLGKELFNFFNYRENYSGYVNPSPAVRNWGWLSIYPQALYYRSFTDKRANRPEQTTAGVAINHDYEKHMISAMNGRKVMGRSYTSAYPNRFEKEGPAASLWGYNFAEQLAYAIREDPKFLFITGWNEWIAGRYPTWPENEAAVENAFPDECNDEFSRDIEPTKGALKDHYYYQMVNGIRRYKGCRPIPEPGAALSVDIHGDPAQWRAAEPYYAAYIGNTGDRDANGYGDLRYTEYSGRNDIIGARVARDETYLYFLAECQEDLTPSSDPLWMNLYLDCDPDNRGWETFDYVLNRKAPAGGKAFLERFTGDGFATEDAGEADFSVNGRFLQVRIPKALLGLQGYDFTVNFAWTDNVHDVADRAPDGGADYRYSVFSGDILDFYVSGDVAPGGRFKYSYVSTSANAQPKGPAEGPTEAPTGGPAEAPTEAPTGAPSDTPPEPPAETGGPAARKGCASLCGTAPLLALAAAALLLRGADRRGKRSA